MKNARIGSTNERLFVILFILWIPLGRYVQKKVLPWLRRNELLKEVAEVRQEYAEGNVKFGSVADFMAELDDSEEKAHG